MLDGRSTNPLQNSNYFKQLTEDIMDDQIQQQQSYHDSSDQKTMTSDNGDHDTRDPPDMIQEIDFIKRSKLSNNLASELDVEDDLGDHFSSLGDGRLLRFITKMIRASLRSQMHCTGMMVENSPPNIDEADTSSRNLDVSNSSRDEGSSNYSSILNDSNDSNRQKLNKTYSVSQDDDASSDYSIGIRRSSSGLSIQADQGPRNPKLRDIEDPNEREKLFSRKIQECCKIYDFRGDPFDDLDLRENKIAILLEIQDLFIEDPDLLVSFDSLYEELFKMFTINIFRPLPPSSNQNVPEFDPEEDEPPLEPSWPHLQLVYNVLIRFFDSTNFDVSRANPYISDRFVLKIIQLFESEDPRERDYLKTILHRIYAHFPSLRSYIRRQINNVFFSFMYETEYHNGIADLLELLGSVINGFVLPIKEEHKLFLLKVLMPLHKARTLSAYHAQLSFCIVQFIEKDPSLTESIVNGLLRYWPKVHSTKEVMFLNEVEEILDIIDPSQFQKVMVVLFKQLARCIRSNQFQVAERVLYFWNNDYILSLINDNARTLVPIVFPALYMDPSAHWNRTIHGLIYNALKLSSEMNQKLFHDLVQQREELERKQAAICEDNDRKWRRIKEMADENASKMNYKTT